MKTLALFALLAMTITSSGFEECTQSVKDLVDDVFDFVVAVEQKGFSIDGEPFKLLLSGITEMSNTCIGTSMDLTQFDNCVDALAPTIPFVGKLVTDISSGQTNNIMLDITQIGLQLTNGITVCIQKNDYSLNEFIM